MSNNNPANRVDLYDLAKVFVEPILKEDRRPTDTELSDLISKLALFQPSASTEELESVRRQLEHYAGISASPGLAISNRSRTPWLSDRTASIIWEYWDAYVKYLKGNDFAPKVIEVLSDDTEAILSLCGDPKASTGFRRQGLVMGDVQSGKTANYTGLINRAADAGYGVIILLTGMIEELRSQTQSRLDEGFVGRASADIMNRVVGANRIGVGRERSVTPNVLTSTDFDFHNARANAQASILLDNINQPILLVMKKNVSALSNLIEYLKTQRSSQRLLEKACLLIDDEADNASVNTKKEEENPATINRQIREVLDQFEKVNYVAYTATPFANVLIDPDCKDLFPKDFIYALDAPNNYIGVQSMFMEEGEFKDQVEPIQDAEVFLPHTHKKSDSLNALPHSMLVAIDAFLLTCAIRDLRFEKLKHRTMLINASRFVNMQDKLAKHVKEALKTRQEVIRQYAASDDLWRKQPELLSLFETFEELYPGAGFMWDDVRKGLHESVASVEVVVVNQKTEKEKRLNYSKYKDTAKGRRVITIGGLTLSRGLTLEGLCVSYFYRNSKSYDTLLQMGRWFGYRTDYEDLCRVWMEPVVQEWYAHLALVVDELRSEIQMMHANDRAPQYFGLRVQSHPDTLLVTAKNKMRYSEDVEYNCSYSGRGTETALLPKNVEANKWNMERLNEFIRTISDWTELKGSLVCHGVGRKNVLEFLSKLEISHLNQAFMRDRDGNIPLFDHINQSKEKLFDQWDVRIASGQGSELILSNGHKLLARQRQFEKTGPMPFLRVNKMRVGDVADEFTGLDDDTREAIKTSWKHERNRLLEKGKKPKPGVTPPASWIRLHHRTKPLLTLSVLEPTEPSADAKNTTEMMKASDIAPKHILAISLSFPTYGNDEDRSDTIVYRLNRVALREMGLLGEADAVTAEDEDEID